MDPVTHGITGALLGKGYFSERHGRVAVFAATLGAVFPDVDVAADIVSRDPLAIVKYHRAITHSFVALPVFAFLLALLTRLAVPWVKKRSERFRDIESPPLAILTLIYGIGIASHIVLDGMTSFGTRMWYPISSERVAWDLLFIIDLTFMAILLLPQMLARIYSSAQSNSAGDLSASRRRAWRTWIWFTVGTLAAWLLTKAARYPFRWWVGVLISLILAGFIFLPAIKHWGFRVTRDQWCQAGTVAAVVYLLGCALAHHAAILRAKTFADGGHIEVRRLGALPIPPSLLDWGDAIRSPHGVYEAQFDLRAPGPPDFRFIPDSPPDRFISLAFEQPDVKLYWQFARFPSIYSFVEGRDHVIELGENRFSQGDRRSPQPFTYRVVFDAAGDLIEQGWLTNGVPNRRLRQMVPQPPAPPPPKKSR
ncbi:MAG TPA: metal-dependent hydrolase [Terriglobia bacterium]|nr:metal-dependent hydrolase [Terriglobia bacterium]